jgi:hypothetical protein
MGAGLVWLCVVGCRRSLAPQAIAAAAIVLFLATNKVFSPTYDVWLVPFFVLLPIRRRVWVTFCSVDLVIYALVYSALNGVISHDVVLAVLPFLVVIRLGVLASLFRAAIGSQPPSPPVRMTPPESTGKRRGWLTTTRS